MEFSLANVTKRDLILDIAKSTGFTQNQIKTVIEEFLEVVTDSLAEQKNIEIRGFGTFHTKARKARAARNPKTGESVQLEESLAPLFKFSSDLRKKVDEAHKLGHFDGVESHAEIIQPRY